MTVGGAHTTRRRGVRRALAVAASAGLALLATLGPLAGSGGAQTAARDYPIPGGWFYSQESRAPADVPPFRGYTVIDDGDAAFWTEFRRYGGLDVLGFPVSRRYRSDLDGLWHQAFQRGILQWRPWEGKADLDNVYDQFTSVGLDDQLEILGVPRPIAPSNLPFAQDAERRMAWLTEPRFLARYFFDPLNLVPFSSQEEAWQFLGLPETFPERPAYYREKLNGKFGPPLYQNYLIQRFQKGALQLFLEDAPADPTVVPGDGKAGCVALTATGRIARRLGAGKIIPGTAVQPEPLEQPPRVHFVPSVPPTTTQGQQFIQFGLQGTGFDPGEPVTIRLTPVPGGTNVTITQGGTSPANSTPAAQPVVSRVDAAGADGSFDQVLTARVGQYTVDLKGEKSGRTLDPTQDPVLDLTKPTGDVAGASSRATYC